MDTRRRSSESFGSPARGAIWMCCVALLVATACVGSLEEFDNGSGRGGRADAGPTGQADARATDGEPETACDDGLDNDGDGPVDCDDADCALQRHCAWPSEMRMDIELAYDASSLAESYGVGDCVTQLQATVADTGEPSCDTCDRGYRGPYVYGTDTCPDAPRPSEGSYGVRFVSDTERELYVLDELGVWQQVGMATGGAGVFTLSRADPVDYEGYDAGDTTTTITLTDQ